MPTPSSGAASGSSRPLAVIAIGRHKDVSHKIDHEIEHVARPVRLHAHDIQPPRDRAIERVDHQRDPEPGEHRRPVLAHGLQQRDQGDARPHRREDMHGKRSGPRWPAMLARKSCWLAWSICRQCYQELPRFAHPRLRRSAAQIAGNIYTAMRA